MEESTDWRIVNCDCCFDGHDGTGACIYCDGTGREIIAVEHIDEVDLAEIHGDEAVGFF